MTDRDGRANILIVDDKPENIFAVETVLEGLDHRITRASSGRDALRHLLNEEFAVILMDINMPDMDGLEAASLIRRRQSSQHIPIIFITASSDEMHMARSYSLGAVDYIQTPFAPNVLRSKVSVFIELHQKTALVRRQTEMERRRATQLQKLSVASMAINSAAGVEQMLPTIAHAARDILDSHQCVALCHWDAAWGAAPWRISSAASFSDRHARWRDRRMKLDQLAHTIIAKSPTVTRLNEAELRSHADLEILRGADLPAPSGGLLAAPLKHLDGKHVGLILLMERADGQFTGEDESLLMQLAQIASIAIQNAIFAREREANRLKDEFLATLSHELRTPLNAIVGWTQLLRMQKLPAEAQHGLSVIDRNVKAQAKLIEDLLDVSRINVGKMRLSLHHAGLEAIVQAAVDVIKPAAETKGLELSVELASGLQIFGDPDRLQQVIWNLLSNAIKFTPAGGRVQVSMERVNSHVQIRIADTGAGIDPGFLKSVFDRFRQGDSSSTRSQGGLGIGLTIARHIVELHGGTISAHSEGLGHGSTFTVMLPLSSQPAPDGPGGPARASPAEAPFAASLAGKRVLVVDDEADAREVLREILSRAGAEVMTAGSVRKAMEALSGPLPDVLVSDIGMPEEDGFSLIRELRKSPAERGGRLPAIAVTAYARDEDRIQILRAGFQLHLSKPVQPQELINSVSWLANDHTKPSTEAPVTA